MGSEIIITSNVPAGLKSKTKASRIVVGRTFEGMDARQFRRIINWQRETYVLGLLSGIKQPGERRSSLTCVWGEGGTTLDGNLL